MLHIGFTGTRKGMTKEQMVRVKYHFGDAPAERITMHLGDCKGADTEAHALADGLGIKLHGHPPDNPRHRSFLRYDVTEEPLPYLERNHAIVDACNILIATPKEHEEVLRSGTWATIRYAKAQNKPIVIIYPDGNEQELNDD